MKNNIMKNRIKVEFKFGKHTIFKSPRDLTIIQLEHMKTSLALTCKCDVDDIEVIYNAPNKNLSSLDVSKNGLHFFDKMKLINGIKFPFELGSDEHLDAIKNGDLDDKLLFI